jgi:hypothetical protein
MRTLQELNKKICEALNVDYKEFEKMTFEQRDAIIRRYTKEKSNLKFKQHK